MPTIDPDDLPGYLHDAYGAAFDHGLQSLNLSRIGAGGNRMWQCSSRFTRSSGFHVEIEADPFDAILKALDAWTRVERADRVEPADLKQERREDRDEPAPEPANPRAHVLYETADKDRPEQICDRNGEVVLGLCKVCGMAEIELDLEPVCPGPRTAPVDGGLFD